MPQVYSSIMKEIISECIRMDTDSGVGSSYICIPRFSYVRLNTFNLLMSYVDSPLYGASFTALQNVEVWMTHGLANPTGSSASYYGSGISLNATAAECSLDMEDPSGYVGSIPVSKMAAVGGARIAGGYGGGQPVTATFSGKLAPGDILRPHLYDTGWYGEDRVQSFVTVLVKSIPAYY